MPIPVQVTQVGLEASIKAAAAAAGRNLKVNVASQEAARKTGRNLGIDLGANSRSIDSLSRPLGKITGQADEFTKSMEAANARVLAFGASVGVLAGVVNGFQSLVRTTIEVEKTMANINSVLGKSASELDKFKSEIFDVARATGSSFETVSTAALELSRQGLSSTEVISRLNDAMILSRLSGLGAAESVDGLTAAFNSFKDQGETSATILNKVAAAAAAYAVSEKDLIEGIKRSGSVAQQAGVNLNELASIITAVQERTSAGGAVIGNSFKTIFTRIGKEDTLAALKGLGIEITDVSGRILPATKLLENLAQKIDGLSQLQISEITQKVGGGFQIDKLLASLKDMSSESSVFKGTMKELESAGDKAYSRNIALNETLAASINTAGINLKELANTLGEIGITGNLNSLLSFFNSFAEGVQGILDGEGIGSQLARGIVKGIGNIISGPGLAIFGAIIIKLSYDLIKFGAASLKSFFGVNQASKEMATLQGTIANALLNNKKIQSDILALEGNRVAQAAYFSTALDTQIAKMNQMRAIAADIAPIVMGDTPLLKGKKTSNSADGYVPTAAEGYAPAVAQESANIKKGVGGARPSDRPVVIPNFSFGGGKTGAMVAHTGEHIVKNYGGSGGSAVFNRDMVKSMGLPDGAQKIGAAGGFIPNFVITYKKKFGVSETTVDRELKSFNEYRLSIKKSATNRQSIYDNVDNAGDDYKEFRGSSEKRNIIKAKQESNILNRQDSKGKARYAYVYNSNETSVKNLDYRTSKDNTGTYRAIGVSVEPGNYLYDIVRSGLIQNAKDYAKQLNINPDIVKDEEFGKIVGQTLNRGSVEGALGTVFESAFQASIQAPPSAQNDNFDIKEESFGNLEEIFQKIGGDKNKVILSQALKGKFKGGEFKNALNPDNIASFYKKIDNDIAVNLAKKTPKAAANKARTSASGFIPNFADPLKNAISREVGAGVEPSKVYVDQHNSLKNSGNPMGLMVANRRDEPAGGFQGIARARKEGVNAQTYGAAKGFVSKENKEKKNYIYDSDKLGPTLSKAVLDKILKTPTKIKKDGIIGPSGAGKSTLAIGMGEFIRSLSDVEKADSFTILSGSELAKTPTGISKRLQEVLKAIKDSKGGTLKYLNVPDEEIEKRRLKRAENGSDDLRSQKQLEGSFFIKKNQPEFIESLQKEMRDRFQYAARGFVPNFASQNAMDAMKRMASYQGSDPSILADKEAAIGRLQNEKLKSASGSKILKKQEFLNIFNSQLDGIGKDYINKNPVNILNTQLNNGYLSGALDIDNSKLKNKISAFTAAKGFVPNFVSQSRELGRGVQGAFYKLGEKDGTQVGVKKFFKDGPSKAVEMEWLIAEFISKYAKIPSVFGPKNLSTLEDSKRKLSIRKEVVSDPLAKTALGSQVSNAFGSSVLFNALGARGLSIGDLHGSNYTVNKNAENEIDNLKNYPQNSTGAFSTLRNMASAGAKISILDPGAAKVSGLARDTIGKIITAQPQQKNAAKGFVPNFANQKFDKSLLTNSKIDSSSPMLSLKAGDQTNYGKFLKIEPAENTKSKYLNAIFESSTGRNVKYSSEKRKGMEFGGGLVWDSVRKEALPNKNLKNRLYNDNFYSILANPVSKYAEVSSKMKVFFDSKNKLDGENLRIHEWNSGKSISDNISVEGENLVIEDINPNFSKPIQFNDSYRPALNQAAADLKLKVITRSKLDSKTSKMGELARFKKGSVGSIPKYAKGFVPNFALNGSLKSAYDLYKKIPSGTIPSIAKTVATTNPIDIAKTGLFAAKAAKAFGVSMPKGEKLNIESIWANLTNFVQNPEKLIKNQRDLTDAKTATQTILNNDILRDRFAKFAAQRVNTALYNNKNVIVGTEDERPSGSLMDIVNNKLVSRSIGKGTLISGSDEEYLKYRLLGGTKSLENYDGKKPSQYVEKGGYLKLKKDSSEASSVVENAYSASRGGVGSRMIDEKGGYYGESPLMGGFTGRRKKIKGKDFASYKDVWDVALNSAEKKILNNYLNNKTIPSKDTVSSNNSYQPRNPSLGFDIAPYILRELVSSIPKAKPAVFKGVVTEFYDGSDDGDDDGYSKGFIPNFAIDLTKPEGYVENQRKRSYQAKTYSSAKGFVPNYADPRSVKITLAQIAKGLGLAAVKVLVDQYLGDGFLDSLEKTGLTSLKPSDAKMFLEVVDKPTKGKHRKAFEKALMSDPGMQRQFPQYHSKLLSQSSNNASDGFMPNFADPLKNAISREVGAGVNPSQVYVDQHSSLKNSGNPMGLMVANRRDEPSGGFQGIARARKEGQNAQTYGAVNGFVPNFANVKTVEKVSQSVASATGIQINAGAGEDAINEFATNAKKAGASMKKLSNLLESELINLGVDPATAKKLTVASVNEVRARNELTTQLIAESKLKSAQSRLKTANSVLEDVANKKLKEAIDRQIDAYNKSAKTKKDLNSLKSSIGSSADQAGLSNRQSLSLKASASELAKKAELDPSKSTEGVVGKLILFQTVTAGLTGLFDGLGGKVGKFGEALTGVTGAILSIALLKSSIGPGPSPFAGAIDKVKNSKAGAAIGAVGGGIVGKTAGFLGGLAGGLGKLLPYVGMAIFAFQALGPVLKLFGVDMGSMMKKFGQFIGVLDSPAKEAANKLRELGKVDISNITEGNFSKQGPSALATFLQGQNAAIRAEKAGLKLKDAEDKPKDAATLNKELLEKEFEYASFKTNKKLYAERSGLSPEELQAQYTKGGDTRFQKKFTEDLFNTDSSVNRKVREGPYKGVSNVQAEAISSLDVTIAKFASKQAQKEFLTAKESGFSPKQMGPYIEKLINSGIENIGADKVEAIKYRLTKNGDFTNEKQNKELVKENIALQKQQAQEVAKLNYEEKINLEIAQLRLESSIKLKMANIDLPTAQDSALTIEKELLNVTDARRVSIEKEIEARSRGKELLKSQVESVKGLTVNSKELLDQLQTDPNNDVLVKNWDKVSGIVGKYADTLMETGSLSSAEAAIQKDITSIFGDKKDIADKLFQIINKTTESNKNLFDVETRRLDINRKNNAITEAQNYFITLQNAKKQEGLDIDLRAIANAEKLNSVNDRIFKARAEGIKSITSKDVGDKIDKISNNRERASAVNSTANEQKKILADVKKDLIKTVIDKKLPEKLNSEISGAKSIDALKPIAIAIAKAEREAAIMKLDAAFKDQKMVIDSSKYFYDTVKKAAEELAMTLGQKPITYQDLINKKADELKNASPASKLSLVKELNELTSSANAASGTAELSLIQSFAQRKSELSSAPFSSETSNRVQDASDAIANSVEELTAKLEELNPAYSDAKKALENNFTKSLLNFENKLSKVEFSNVKLNTQKELSSARIQEKIDNPETYIGTKTEDDYLAKKQSLEMQKLISDQSFQSKIDNNTAAVELERKLYTLENITAIKDNSQVIRDLIAKIQEQQAGNQIGVSNSATAIPSSLVSKAESALNSPFTADIFKDVNNQANNCAKVINAFAKSLGISINGATDVANSFQEVGVAIDQANIKAGDILIKDRGKGPGEAGGHVGMYLGDNKVLQATQSAYSKAYPNSTQKGQKAAITDYNSSEWSMAQRPTSLINPSVMSQTDSKQYASIDPEIIKKAVVGVMELNVEFDKIPEAALKAAGNMNLQEEAQQRVAGVIAETVRQSQLRNLKDEEAIKFAEDLFKIKNQGANSSFAGGYDEGIRNLNRQTENFSFSLGERVPQMFSDNMANAMEEIILKGGDVGDVLMDAATSFLNEINKATFKNIADKIVSGQGGSIFKFASGGKITGGSGNKDDVPAMLMGGEFVMNKKAVSKYGDSFMEKINKGSISHFAKGGKVEDAEFISERGLGTQAANNQYPSTQTGKGGFFTPGLMGSGSITGKKDLLNFATQSYTSGENDIIRSGKNSASIDLETESVRLTNFGRRNGPQAQALKEAKSQSFDVYKQQLDQEKQIKEAQEAYDKERKAKIKGLLTQIGVSAAMFGASTAANGINAAKIEAKGLNLTGMDANKFALAGAFKGGNIDGTNVGGLGNLFKGNFALSQISNKSQLSDYYDSKIPKATVFAGDKLGLVPEDYVAPSNNLAYSTTGPWNGEKNAQRRATGGQVPRTAGIDTVSTMLSGGEFVMNASATSRIGPEKLNQMNSGATQTSNVDSEALNEKLISKLDELIEASKTKAGSVTVNVSSDGSSQTSSSKDQTEQDKNLSEKIKNSVLQVIAQEKRMGGMLAR